MSVSDDKSTPSNIFQGPIDKLVQIGHLHGNVEMLSPSVFDRLITAISEQKSIPDNAQRMREAVAQVLAMLRSKSALYADLDNEFWGAVFASLRDLRNALTETRG